MKTYKIIKSEGNVNGWHSPKETGETTIPESHAEILNAQKDNTGIEYVLSGEMSDIKAPVKHVKKAKEIAPATV